LVVAVIAMSMMVNPMRPELARRLHELRRVPAKRLSSLLTHLARDAARRLRSGRLVRGGALFAAAIAGRGFDLPATLRRPPPAEDASGGAPASDPGPPDRP
jgi:hypothetical protein